MAGQEIKNIQNKWFVDEVIEPGGDRQQEYENAGQVKIFKEVGFPLFTADNRLCNHPGKISR